ncbi:unnamed protein product [Ranitomeya imitator]|uniref:DUF382 domain-containing protein n=1 Tax=Ranitomeya imitator TaxID=111125 RepID=A0ABN9LKC9_9NEOB|nr:unnamed protein product [Ranitomeya imitator]
MAEIMDGGRDDGELAAGQAHDDDDDDMAATNSRLAQMAGMPMPTPPPTMGMGFPHGLNPRLAPDQENGKPPQAGVIPQPNDGLPKATLLEPEATRSLLLSRGNLVTNIPPLMPSLNRMRALNQSGDDSKDMEDSLSGPKIPQVLEKILQLKEIRQEEMMIPVATEEEDYDDSHFYYDIEEETTGPTKEKKGRRRKNRKKRTRRRATAAPSAVTDDINEAAEALAGKVEIEYVTEEPDIYDPNFIFFKRIFQAFKMTLRKKRKKKEPEKVEKIEPAAPRKRFEEEMMDSDSDSDAEDKKLDAPKLSKKKLRRMNRFTVAELKQLVSRPDVVEMHDVTAQDPKLLVHLKGTRNSVPVPRHWCFKRKYLQGKRGMRNRHSSSLNLSRERASRK